MHCPAQQAGQCFFYSIHLQRFVVISLLFFFAPLFLFAQYSRADSLRGALRPERTCFDVGFYNLNISVDTAAKSISGYNEIVFKVLDQTERIQIDLFANMVIDSIVFHRLRLAYTREFSAVFVDFPGYLMQGMQEKIKVYYHGKPISVSAKESPWEAGFVWQKDKNGKPWIGVACEGGGASLWWPNKDHLSDEPDSMRVTCEVPGDLQCISNGVLEKHSVFRGNINYHVSVFQWKINYPINNYNVTLNIGDYVHFGEDYISGKDTLKCDYYVLPYNLEKAKEHFKQVKPMLAIYENLFGPYPFWKDGYALVETAYWGMEHQGAVAYGNRYLKGKFGHVPEDSVGVQLKNIDFDYIIIHESGHEYWGNSVSMKDMADMWIHEGFCTYTEVLYVEKFYGYDDALKYLRIQAESIDNDKPIIGDYNVNKEGSGDMYPKGSWMLHTIRNIVNNDSLWFATIKGITTDFKISNVDTKQIEDYMELKLNKELTPVFDQYLRHKELPVLKVEVKKHFCKVDVTCALESNVPGFSLPLLYSMDNGVTWKELTLNNNKAELRISKKQYQQMKFSNHLHLFKVQIIPNEKLKK